MIRVTQVSSTSAELPSAWHYTLGGQRVVFQSRIQALDAYEEGPASDRYAGLLKSLGAASTKKLSEAHHHYTGLAPFAGGLKEIQCWHHLGYYQLNVQGKPVCTVDVENKHIHVLNDSPFDERLNLEIVTGPAMMLLMAAEGTFTLHGGAIQIAGNDASRVVAFIAESGTGKSTLSADAGAAWPQLADDMLPLSRGNEDERGFLVHGYPQLKLDQAAPEHRIDSKHRLAALFRLSPIPADAIGFRHINKSEALLQVVRHTVAAKLFDEYTMRRHARFARELCLAVPMLEVEYPRDLARLPELQQQIMQAVDRVLL